MTKPLKKNNNLVIVIIVIFALFATLAIMYFLKIENTLYKKQQNFIQEVFILQQQVQSIKSDYQKNLTQLQTNLQAIETKISTLPNSIDISKEDLMQLSNLAKETKTQINSMATITLLNSLYNLEQVGNSGKDSTKEYNAFSNYLNLAFPNNNKLAPYLKNLQRLVNSKIPSQSELLTNLDIDAILRQTNNKNNLQNIIKNWFKTQIKIEYDTDANTKIDTSIKTKIKNAILHHNYKLALSIIQNSSLIENAKWKNFMQQLKQKIDFIDLIKQIRLIIFNNQNG